MSLQSSPRPFGVLGGMGPASTVRFLERVLARFREYGAIRNPEFPQITLQTIPNSEHLSSEPEQGILRDLERASQVFAVAGAEFVVAPCNTVHRFLPLPGDTIPFLSIVAATCRYLPGPLFGSRILFLSTRQTRSSGVFEPFFAHTGVQPVWVTEEHQASVDHVLQYSNAGGDLPQHSATITDLIARYEVDAVLLACTELSQLTLPEAGPVVVDTLEALAEAAFRASTRSADLEHYGLLGPGRSVVG